MEQSLSGLGRLLLSPLCCAALYQGSAALLRAQTVSVSSGQANSSVTIVTEPAGSSLLVNGNPVKGRTPLTLSLPPGPAEITLRPGSEGYGQVSRTYTFQPGPIVLKVTLPKEFGQLRVASAKEWTSLELDGRAVDWSRDSWQRVQTGHHVILAFEGRYLGTAAILVAELGHVNAALAWRKVSPDPAYFTLTPSGVSQVGSTNYAGLNPPRSVHVQAFWIQRNEVTVREYRRCVLARQCTEPASGESCNWAATGREDHPVNCVSAAQAVQYAKWMSASDEFAYRSPTNVEWETVATAGGKRAYPWGSEAVAGRCNICDRACTWLWHDTTVSDGWPETAPAGSLKSCVGPEQVFDLIGNVAEWCSIPGSDRFDLRGGSWSSPRTLNDPRSPDLKPSGFSDASTGFRLAAAATDVGSIRDRLRKKGSL